MIMYIHLSVYIDMLSLLYYHRGRYGRYFLGCHHGLCEMGRWPGFDKEL